MAGLIGTEEEVRTKKRSRSFLSSVAFLQIGTFVVVVAQFGTSPPAIRDPLQLWSGLAFGVIVIGLWVWSGKRPFEAALTALSLYAGLLLENVVVAPAAFLHNQGIMIKGFGLFMLVAAVFFASEHRRLMRERERRAAPAERPANLA